MKSKPIIESFVWYTGEIPNNPGMLIYIDWGDIKNYGVFYSQLKNGSFKNRHNGTVLNIYEGSSILSTTTTVGTISTNTKNLVVGYKQSLLIALCK